MVAHFVSGSDLNDVLLLLLLLSLLVVGNQISFGTPPSTDDQAHVTNIISPHFSLFFFIELDALKGSGGEAAAVVTRREGESEGGGDRR
uniref:Secreted protein n=1 Tax=Nelumbo nucifera TaxID=4432 RepID=A0A822ZUN6_NELNU|nr:TPA_asm: hypothetical protein HUJ06_017002 [Nelumbo nucifera]